MTVDFISTGHLKEDYKQLQSVWFYTHCQDKGDNCIQ